MQLDRATVLRKVEALEVLFADEGVSLRMVNSNLDANLFHAKYVLANQSRYGLSGAFTTEIMKYLRWGVSFGLKPDICVVGAAAVMTVLELHNTKRARRPSRIAFESRTPRLTYVVKKRVAFAIAEQRLRDQIASATGEVHAPEVVTAPSEEQVDQALRQLNMVMKFWRSELPRI